MLGSWLMLGLTKRTSERERQFATSGGEQKRPSTMTLHIASLCYLLLVFLACPMVQPMTEEHRLLERKRRGWVSSVFPGCTFFMA